MKKISLSVVFYIVSVISALAENYPYKSDYLWYAVPDHKDWLYKVGENATIDVMFLKYGVPQDGTVEYQIADDLCDADTHGKVTLKNGKAVITGITSNKPGFRDVTLTTKIDEVKYQHHVKVGFSPEEIKPYVTEPNDFTKWWENNIAENRKVPLQYTKELYKEFCTDKIDCYLVKLKIDKQHYMYGLLQCPKSPSGGAKGGYPSLGGARGGYPVIISSPGAGIKAKRDANDKPYYAENGCIRLVMEIHGINPTYSEDVYNDIRSAFDGRVKGYLYQGIDNRDHYYLNHVYLGLMKAVDFLTSLPEWDGKNVVALGGSQGGGLSLALAGLDPRITHLIINHPALCDMTRGKIGEASGYPHPNDKDSLLTDANVRTLAYFDGVNFARHIKAKTFMTWGYNDNTCPPTTSYAVWNTLHCPKECLITPVNEHWTSDATNREQCTWLLKNLNK